jgi:lipoprotein-releasing system ATP-binding protein
LKVESLGEVVLKLINIQKTFIHDGSHIEVLRGIDLSLSQGDSLAITGASGVGKSTLLNIMGTLELPTQGTVQFMGTNVAEIVEEDLCQLRNKEVGFVFQFHHLLPEFNALENTMMPALIARTSLKKARFQAKNILEKVGLENRLTHRIGKLSGGEQQRVAIARSLIMSPKLLLADEPTGNLDETTGEGIVDLLMRLNKEGNLTVVIATHNLRLAQKFSRILEIKDGRFYDKRRSL